MKNKLFTLLALSVFATFNAFAQCVIPITSGQSYVENFDSGTMECWTVESTGAATWAIMNGNGSNVVAFQNAEMFDEARLISPTFDMSGVSGATFSFGYAMMALYEPDVLTVSYRTSEADDWHELGSYSVNDWQNVYDEAYELPDISSTYQISFLGHSNGGFYIFVDDIEIVPVGGCNRPMNLEATEITYSSALLGWSTTGNEEDWIVEINGNQKPVNTQPYLVENLNPNTEYSFRVKANCGDAGESDWSYPSTFKTRCDVITVTDNEPYFDDFESSEDFICWYNEIAYGTDGWVIDPGYTILNNTAFFIWLGGEARLISAPLDISTVTHPVLTFKHKQPHGDGNADELSVWYATSQNDYWHLLGEYTEITDSWVTETYVLPEPSATYYICFKAKANNANGVYVDEVWVGNGQSVGVPSHVDPEVTNGDVVVYDLFGRQVAKGKLVEGRMDFDMSGLAKGVYVAKIANAGTTTTIKLVKD